jgi:hypothetical protein
MDLHQIIDGVQQAAPYVLAVLIALTALAHALQAAAHAFQRYAERTPTPKDDEVAARLVGYADWTATALDWIGAVLPQIGFGRRQVGRGGAK